MSSSCRACARARSEHRAPSSPSTTPGGLWSLRHAAPRPCGVEPRWRESLPGVDPLAVIPVAWSNVDSCGGSPRHDRHLTLRHRLWGSAKRIGLGGPSTGSGGGDHHRRLPRQRSPREDVGQAQDQLARRRLPRAGHRARHTHPGGRVPLPSSLPGSSRFGGLTMRRDGTFAMPG